MRERNKLQGLLPFLLAAALVFSIGALSARASEMTEATVETEGTEPAVTEEATVPETQPPQRVTIAYAAAMEESAEMVSIRGTVVYAGAGITVLQDGTGGICLQFAGESSLKAGQVIEAEGFPNAGIFSVEGYACREDAQLPEQEASLDSLPECMRVCLKHVTFHPGLLTAGEGALPLIPEEPEGIPSGAEVDVWGVMVNGQFYADTILPVQPPQDLTVSITPADGVLRPGGSITLQCSAEEAAIYYVHSYDGLIFSEEILYCVPIPIRDGAETYYLRAYAKLPDGTTGPTAEFYLEIPEETKPQQTRPADTEPEEEWNLYFGLLHAHTELSGDAVGAVEEAFDHASRVDNLDFFAITDHSNAFDNDTSGDILTGGDSEAWKAGKAAARKVTDGSFVGIYGYEMTWENASELGHISTFGTTGWQSANQEGFSTLDAYCNALGKDEAAVSQINHPGRNHRGRFVTELYHPRYDRVLQLLEVGSEQGYRAYDQYQDALDMGWHVAPTNNQANHHGNWGSESDVRTVVLARKLTQDSLLDAMANRRVYATEDSDLAIVYRLNGSIMGSIIDEKPREITISLKDPTDSAIGTVEVVVDDGAVIYQKQVHRSKTTLSITDLKNYSYYYVRIKRGNDIIAVTAPVWIDREVNIGIENLGFDTEKPQQGQTVWLQMDIYNYEWQDFLLESIDFYLGEEKLPGKPIPERVKAMDVQPYEYAFSSDALGKSDLRVVVKGTINGAFKTCQKTHSLRYQSSQSVDSDSDIAKVRSGTVGEEYRIEGYVTVGTSKPQNTFPGMLFLQDSTGGIAVGSFTDTGIQPGTKMWVTGYLSRQGENPVLELIDYDTYHVEEDHDHCQPKVVRLPDLKKNTPLAGQLVQIQGRVQSLTRTQDALGVSRFTLKDTQGNQAWVWIEDTIGHGTGEKNSLTSVVKGNNLVQAIGIVWLEEDGMPVIRVRNCDEVKYASSGTALADPSNPKTGGQESLAQPQRLGIGLYLLLCVMGVTATGMAALYTLWKNRR